ncbi:hypothetical protein N431DRAFT_371753 [Stipitochalara longipes BDJ]|nr:hypothetical protein N431DRAFT_371753 [Stipitochalara longipes BDJ]
MAGHEHTESPHMNARQIHAAAIIQNIVRYYIPDCQSSPRAQNEKPTPSSSTSSATSANTCTTAVQEQLELPPGTSKLRQDPTLTAFTQLAAFRLDTERSFISLIDHEHQYILAEATRSVSLQNPEKCLPGDELFVGAVKLPAAWGLCPDTLHVFTAEDDKSYISTQHVTANQHCYVINDLAEVDCFKEKPYVSGWPFVRFYAEVPLKSSGIVIGSICVADSKPRYGIDVASLDMLAEVASAVAAHLDLVQAQNLLRRSQEMVRGLGQFVDGKSVREWWKDTFNDEFQGLNVTKKSASEQRPGFAQTLSTSSVNRYTLSPKAQSPGGTLFHNEPDTGDVEQPPVNRFDSLEVTVPRSSRSHTNDVLPTGAHRAQDTSSHLEVPGQPSSPIVQRGSLPSSDGSPPPRDPAQHEQVAYKAIQRLFSRASHLIRDSSNLDGIIFIDASLQDIAVSENRQKSFATPANTPRFGGVPESSTGQFMSNKRSSSVNTGSIDLPAFIRQGFKAQIVPNESTTTHCQLLGYSLNTDSRRHGDAAPSDQHLNVSQSALRSLLRRYPNGNVFLFNSDGTLLHDKVMDLLTRGTPADYSSSLAKGKSNFEKEKDQLRAYQLLDICPGARGMIFFPLWDPQRDQWFAGSLAWTKDPSRVLESEDVTFLAAFGSCIMAEKSKMDALSADRAKSDFISSVSHELRSPLHGILATVEVLADTAMTMEQNDLIRTVSTCGEVLMDTMDHILDYAKLTNSKKQRKLTTGQPNEPGQRSSHAVRITTFDLSNLVECVVEGIFAGHNYRTLVNVDNMPPEQARRTHQQSAARLTPPSMNPNVMVIVDIEQQLTWLFDSQIGAWKRILTNLFGNALKYTEAGFVRVSLSAVPIPLRPKYFVVTLEIQDSGIGMSKDYIQHRLYTPFAQVNPMSTGTGLGLSIVRQLINDLEGSIDIESEVGYGTWVKVSIPAFISSSDQPDEQSVGSTAKIRDIKVWCVGLKICLVGFDYYPEIEEAPTGILTTHARRMLAIRSSMTTLLAEWFGMVVVTAPSIEEAKGDILMGMQSQLNMVPKQIRPEPLIIFEDHYSGYRGVNEDGVFHLAQPVGPHKLARILGHCLEYRSWVGTSPDSPYTPPGRAPSRTSSYGFSQLPEVSQDIQQDIPPKTESARAAHSRSKLDVPTVAGTPRPTPVLVKPRSIVLLVEDNSVNMKILVNHMKRAKEEYISAVNGLEALHKYQAEHQSIKVIFMDISMPVKDGITATKEIRQFELEASLPRIRIAVLTCFSSEEYQTNAFAAGADLFLIKPVPMKALKPILEMNPEVVVPP